MRLSRSMQMLAAVVTAGVLFSTSRVANAQPYSCSSTDICFNGVNTATSNGQAVFGQSTKGSAVVGQDTSSGQGVLGQSTSGIGVVGTVDVSLTLPYSPPSGTYGGYFENSTGGSGSYGVYASGVPGGYFTSSAGNGVRGVSGGTGNSGVYGTNAGSGGAGVNGQDTESGATGYGGNFSSTNGTGVTTSGAAYGIYASSSGYAVWSEGALVVNGTPYCNGCTAFTSYSDSRLKKDIKPLQGALDQLLKLHGVTFEWIDPAKRGNHEGMQRGFIAQEVEKVIPEWVGVDKDGFKTLNTTGIEPMLVESVREQQVEINDLKEQIKAMQYARRPIASVNWGLFGAGLVIGGVLFINNRRKKDEDKS